VVEFVAPVQVHTAFTYFTPEHRSASREQIRNTIAPLFCVQAALVSIRKTGVHRKLRVAGAVAALAVITSGVVVLTRAVPRRLQDGVVPHPEPLEGFREVVLFQTFSLALFTGCVGAAIHFRRRPDVHKRLMMIASVLVIPAALSTNRDFGAALQSVLPGFLPVGYMADLMLIASLLVFDLVRHRRLLATSIFGAVLIVLVRPVWMSLTVHSDLGIQWTNWLGRIPT
jgi:hypothetical protein